MNMSWDQASDSISCSGHQELHRILALTRLLVFARAVWTGRPLVDERAQMQMSTGAGEMQAARRSEREVAVLRSGIGRRDKPGEQNRQVHQGQRNRRRDHLAI